MALNRFNFDQMFRSGDFVKPSVAEQLARSIQSLAAEPSVAEQLARSIQSLATEPSVVDLVSSSAHLATEPSVADLVSSSAHLAAESSLAQLVRSSAHLAAESSLAQLARSSVHLAAESPLADLLFNSFEILSKPSATERLAKSFGIDAAALTLSARLQFKSHGGILWGRSVSEFDPHEILKPLPTQAELEHGVTRILRTFDELAEIASQESFPSSLEPTDQDVQPSSSERREQHTESESGLGHSGVDRIPSRRIALPRAKSIQAFAPIRLLICSAAQDSELKDALVKHISLLRRQGLIEPWHEDDISAGSERESIIWDNFHLAQIVLLLLSADFICHKLDQRMDRAIEEKHRSAIVIPVLVRDVDLTDSVFDRKIHPMNRCPVARSPAQDRVWKKVAVEVRSAVTTLRTRAKRLSS